MLRFNIQSIIREVGFHTKLDCDLCKLKQTWFRLQAAALYSKKKGGKMEALKRAQPPWKAPEGQEVPKLKLYNSLTRQKAQEMDIQVSVFRSKEFKKRSLPLPRKWCLLSQCCYQGKVIDERAFGDVFSD